MERLTKKELRALLECIKECYSICDVETFAQHVVSRLTKIVSAEITSYSGGNPRRRREPRVGEQPIVIHHGKTRETTQGLFPRLGLRNKFYPRLGAKYRIAPRLIKQVAVNCKTKNLAVHEKFLLKLLRPHLSQACRNAQTITHMRQKLTLVDRALYRLNFGLIFLTPDGKIHLATTGAMQQVASYLGPQFLRGNICRSPCGCGLNNRTLL
jgi:hypothetical protein